MKRLIYIILFSIAHITFGMDAVWIDEEDRVSISHFTTAIHQRYYYLARLEAVHDLIKTIDCSSIVTNQDFKALTLIQPEHPRIIKCIDTMQQEGSCYALLALWRELSAYKYLEDEQCSKEYSALVCLVAYQLITNMQSQLTIEDQRMLSVNANRAPTALHDISSYDVAYRYYIIKRLKNVIALLHHCSYENQGYTILNYLPACCDARIVHCAQEIESSGSLIPLILLTRDFEQFQSISDTNLIHELLELILTVEQYTLAPRYLPRNRELCAHYEHEIEGLSIEELLKSIDILTAHIEPYAVVNKKEASIFAWAPGFATLACLGIAAWYVLPKSGVHS